MSKKNNIPLRLAFCACAIAIAFLLSNVKLFPMPFGGTVSLCSMFFISLIGLWYGPVYGIITGIAYGFLQLIIDPYILTPVQVILDYPLAFGALGLSGFFHKAKFKCNVGKVFSFNNLHVGYIVGVIGRWICSSISGYVFFASYAADWNMSPLPYTMIYNGLYLGAEAIITLILISLAPVNKAIKHVSNNM